MTSLSDSSYNDDNYIAAVVMSHLALSHMHSIAQHNTAQHDRALRSMQLGHHLEYAAFYLDAYYTTLHCILYSNSQRPFCTILLHLLLLLEWLRFPIFDFF